MVFGLAAAAVIAVLTGSMIYTERSEFCPTCHEMGPYYSAWQTSGHAAQAQCVDCHVDPGLVAHLAHKPIALKEVWDHFTRDNRFPNWSVEVPNGRCTGCHPSVVKKSASRFSHALHEKKGSCKDCHATVGHEVTLASLKDAGILKTDATGPPRPGGMTPSNAPGHRAVVCQRCHDQAKMKCTTCHQAPHEAKGECSLCHKPGSKFVFVHPNGADCGGCHKKSPKHRPTTAACTSCHAAGGKSWAFKHPASADCRSCHTPPPNHFGTSCTSCHSVKVPFARAVFRHPGGTGEHSYRSFACVKCHPRGYGSASCTCHGGRAPSGG